MQTMTNTKPAAKKSSKGVAMVLAGSLIGATALTALTSLVPTQTAKAETVLNRAPRQGFADLVEKLMPTVVSVKVQMQQVSGTGRGNGFSFGRKSPNSPFEFFFDRAPNRGGTQPRARQPRRQGVGSGFIVSADGFIVTNNHVVKDAVKVTITLADGTEYQAKVVGTDPKTDLAVLKIQADRTFKFAKLATKDPRVGDWVIAVGNPFGLGGTVTTGIISATGRDIGSGPYDNFLQIDASINRGNSGGPAFNLNGEVIGVNTAIFSPSGGSVGIGFAIPASTTKQIIDDLINNGNVSRGWLGVQIQKVSKDIAESLGLPSAKGTLVAQVTQGSPAAAAGLKTGDTILKVNGKPVKGPRDLARLIAGVEPGSDVSLDIVRKRSSMNLVVKIGKMPASFGQPGGRSKPKPVEPKLSSLGIEVEPAEEGPGVVIRDLDPNGKIAQKGIKPGDVIVEVGGITIDDQRGLAAAFKRAARAGKSSVLILLRSRDRQRFVAIPVG